MSGSFEVKTHTKFDCYGESYTIYKWEVILNGYNIRGESSSVRQSHRHAKREVRRYKRMQKFLDDQ